MDWLNRIPLFENIIIPILDVGLLSFLLYQSYSILEETKAIQLLKGAVTIALVYALALFFNLSTMLWILNKLVPGIMIALAIVFQPELRRIFTRIGQREIFRFKARSRSYHIDYVLNALEVLGSRKRGALVVFSRTVGLKNILDTGTKLNADLSSSLIITLFGHDTPLHDGAMVVVDGKIAAAGCFLPLSKQGDIRKSFGTRHRAALGLAEESDAVILVASEETGAISLAYDSNLFYGISVDEAGRQLRRLLQVQDKENLEGSP
ncbi:MAG: diadenylate cyclase CdaA [Spirochaetaceae bacterium]|jgi:diadenylate cyclase|nr:diadenylate cyclase CdaA [Spirochaetaceae bacterium]